MLIMTRNVIVVFPPPLWVCGVLATIFPLGINYVLSCLLSKLIKQGYHMNRVGATKENEMNTFENYSLKNRTRFFLVSYYQCVNITLVAILVVLNKASLKLMQ